MEPSAKVILDSVSPSGSRLTTFEVVMHRFVLAEFNTHRAFSRNSASSRAIPVSKQLDKVENDPAWPIVWPSEQPGMQGGSELSGVDLEDALILFEKVKNFTHNMIQAYIGDHPDAQTRLHKSLLNRLIEPFMWHTAIVSATDWDGFWDQRCSELAQPEIRATADAMSEAYLKSDKQQRLEYGQWHLPYLRGEDFVWAKDDNRSKDQLAVKTLQKISVARCARVSYLSHDGIRDPQKDVDMYDKLVSADPPHASPLEHVATPTRISGMPGNFKGWEQLRHIVLDY